MVVLWLLWRMSLFVRNKFVMIFIFEFRICVFRFPWMMILERYTNNLWPGIRKHRQMSCAGIFQLCEIGQINSPSSGSHLQNWRNNNCHPELWWSDEAIHVETHYKLRKALHKSQRIVIICLALLKFNTNNCR